MLDLPSVELADALQATNALHMQDGDRLYVVGGYGYSRTSKEFVTHDLLISIDVPLAVRAVMTQNATLLATAVRSVREPRLQLSGGGLQKLNGWYSLSLSLSACTSALPTHVDCARSMQVLRRAGRPLPGYLPRPELKHRLLARNQGDYYYYSTPLFPLLVVHSVVLTRVCAP